MNQYYADPAETVAAPLSTGPVEIVVIADRSGSMASICDDAIGGFNTYLAEQQKLPGEARMTLVLFDDKYEVPVEYKPLTWVRPLTPQTFVPRGSTALFDAIGRSLTTLEARRPKHAVIVILTDGQENASTVYTSEMVKQRITAAEARGWRVIYLAANQDAFAVGGAIGVNAAFTKNYAATADGVRSAYLSASTGSSDYRTTVGSASNGQEDQSLTNK